MSFKHANFYAQSPMRGGRTLEPAYGPQCCKFGGASGERNPGMVGKCDAQEFVTDLVRGPLENAGRAISNHVARLLVSEVRSR